MHKLLVTIYIDYVVKRLKDKIREKTISRKLNVQSFTGRECKFENHYPIQGWMRQPYKGQQTYIDLK